MIFRVREDGRLEILHTFSAADATSGANYDGAFPDEGVVLNGNKLIEIAVYGGAGSPAGLLGSAAPIRVVVGRLLTGKSSSIPLRH